LHYTQKKNKTDTMTESPMSKSRHISVKASYHTSYTQFHFTTCVTSHCARLHQGPTEQSC